jgi:hypothetical protein
MWAAPRIHVNTTRRAETVIIQVALVMETLTNNAQ